MFYSKRQAQKTHTHKRNVIVSEITSSKKLKTFFLTLLFQSLNYNNKNYNCFMRYSEYLTSNICSKELFPKPFNYY